MQSSSQAWKMWQPENMEIELCLRLHCPAHLWKERHRKDYCIKACRNVWHALMARDWLHVKSLRRLRTWMKRMTCSWCWLEPKPPIILMITVFMLLSLCCYSRRWRWWWLCSWNCSLCSWEEQKSADDEKERENGKLRSISECTRKEFKAFRGNDSFGFLSFPCSAFKFGKKASIPRKGWGSSLSGSFSRSSLVLLVSPLVSSGSLLLLPHLVSLAKLLWETDDDLDNDYLYQWHHHHCRSTLCESLMSILFVADPPSLSFSVFRSVISSCCTLIFMSKIHGEHVASLTVCLWHCHSRQFDPHHPV